MSRVRPFVPDDIPQAASLNWRFLQGGEGPAPTILETYFQELFFCNPWFDSRMPSLVYEDQPGKVAGFLGVVPRPMSLEGRPVPAAFGSGLVVHPDSRRSLAGLQLLMAFMEGTQELSLTDTASRLSQDIWTRLGGTTAPLSGIHWSWPLRPSLYALHIMARFRKNALSRAFALATRPFCRTIDVFAARMPSSPFRAAAPAFSPEELDGEALLACLSSFAGTYSLRPEYDRDSLGWLLDFMSQMKAYGNLRKVVLRNSTRELVGWYIYYVKRGDVCEVVQVGANDVSIKRVFDHLVHDAWTQGAIGLHGRMEVRFAQALSEKGCLFWGSTPLLVHSRNPELTRLIQNGGAFLTRLDGEWCLKFAVTGSSTHAPGARFGGPSRVDSSAKGRARPEPLHALA